MSTESAPNWLDNKKFPFSKIRKFQKVTIDKVDYYLVVNSALWYGLYIFESDSEGKNFQQLKHHGFLSKAKADELMRKPDERLRELLSKKPTEVSYLSNGNPETPDHRIYKKEDIMVDGCNHFLMLDRGVNFGVRLYALDKTQEPEYWQLIKFDTYDTYKNALTRFDDVKEGLESKPWNFYNNDDRKTKLNDTQRTIAIRTIDYWQRVETKDKTDSDTLKAFADLYDVTKKSLFLFYTQEKVYYIFDFALKELYKINSDSLERTEHVETPTSLSESLIQIRTMESEENEPADAGFVSMEDATKETDWGFKGMNSIMICAPINRPQNGFKMREALANKSWESFTGTLPLYTSHQGHISTIKAKKVAGKPKPDYTVY